MTGLSNEVNAGVLADGQESIMVFLGVEELANYLELAAAVLDLAEPVVEVWLPGVRSSRPT